MNRHAKAPSAGSTEGQRQRRGLFLAVLALTLFAVALIAAPASAAPPAATMGSVSAITETSAHLEGSFTIEPGEEAYWRFDYSTDGVSWTPTALAGGPTQSSETVGGDITELLPNTKYFVRFAIYATGIGQELVSSAKKFTTLAIPGVTPPSVVSIENASSVSYVTAKASGVVQRPAGAAANLDTRCNFEYVTDAQFSLDGFESATPFPCDPPNPITAPGASPATATLTGLAAGTTYHLRLAAENSGGSDVKVAASTFTTQTPTAATVSLGPATGISFTKARISGTVDPEGGNDDTSAGPLPIAWELQINREGAGWQFAAGGVISGPAAVGTNPVTVKKDLQGLQGGSHYEFRLKAVYTGLEAITSAGSFNTPPVPLPSVLSIDDASDVSYISAQATGEVKRPAGADGALNVSCRFELVTDAQFTAHGFEGAGAFPCNYPNPIIMVGAWRVDVSLLGLQPATTYHLRLTAANGGGSDAKVAASTFTTKTLTAPTVSLDPATGASFTKAHISGTVDPEGGNNDAFNGPLPLAWELQINREGTGWQFAAGAAISDAAAVGSNPIPVKQDLEGLQPDAEYEFRLRAQIYDGQEVITPAGEFETLPVDELPSVVSTEDASGVLYSTAQFAGKIKRPTNPDSAFDANCRFEFISDQQFTENQAHGEPLFLGAGSVPCEPAAAAHTPGESVVSSPPPPTGQFLGPGTTYHLRLTVSNAGGSDSKEAAHTFTTLAGPVAPPSVSLDPVAVHTDTTTHFSGHVNPGGADPLQRAFWEFQCTPACPGQLGGIVEPADNTSHEVAVDIHGLEPDTDYEVKLVTSNYAGASAEAGPQSFKTDAGAPAVETVPAFAFGDGTKALIGGRVRPKKQASKYWFEFGKTTAYGSTAPAVKASAGSDNVSALYTEEISGLSPGSTYHFRVVAENASGTSQGEDRSFETPAPAVAASGECPNAKIRTETNSATLPDCRAYESTSEQDKNGGDANLIDTASPDGERVAYFSSVGFGDAIGNALLNSFVAQRGSSGWTTHSMGAPVTAPGLGIGALLYAGDFSEDVSKNVQAQFTGVGAQPGATNIYLTSYDGPPVWVTAPRIPGATVKWKQYVGRSADASHIFFSTDEELIPGVTGYQIYEWFNGQISVVSRDPGTNAPNSSLAIGAGRDGGASTGYNGVLNDSTAVSSDGNRVFLGYPNGGPLYVREGGTETRALSVSHRTGSVGAVAPALFIKAAADGSIVYFTSDRQLTNDAPDHRSGEGFNQIYSLDLETEALNYIGKGVVRFVSEDGSRVYFISSEQLIPGKGAVGAENLYTVDDEGNGLIYVPNHGANDFAYMRATPDGGILTFDSHQRLTAYDNAGHSEIYLYHVAGETLRCISCMPGGQPPTPTGEATLTTLPGPAEVSVGEPRAITDDGSRVIFQTSDPLVPEDANGMKDVYEYSEGRVSLISTGTSPYPSEVGDNSRNGNDIFFVTRQTLVGQDIDEGSKDVYDARVNGGYPAPVPAIPPCENEAACQGTPSTPPSYSSPGTASLVGRGNATSRKPSKQCKGKAKKKGAKCGPKAKKHKAKKHKGKTASKSGRGK